MVYYGTFSILKSGPSEVWSKPVNCVLVSIPATDHLTIELREEDTNVLRHKIVLQKGFLVTSITAHGTVIKPSKDKASTSTSMADDNKNIILKYLQIQYKDSHSKTVDVKFEAKELQVKSLLDSLHHLFLRNVINKVAEVRHTPA